MTSIGFAERVVTAEGPNKGSRIAVETPTTVMALIRFVSRADIVFSMSWDVWKHGHPPIELYGTEGSLRVPDPNFFGGAVEITERGADWQLLDLSTGSTASRIGGRRPGRPARRIGRIIVAWGSRISPAPFCMERRIALPALSPRMCWKSCTRSCKPAPMGARSRSPRVSKGPQRCRTRRRRPTGVAQRPELEKEQMSATNNRPP